jgi:hypothetical protein
MIRCLRVNLNVSRASRALQKHLFFQIGDLPLLAELCGNLTDFSLLRAFVQSARIPNICQSNALVIRF